MEKTTTGNLELIVPNGYRFTGEGYSGHSHELTQMAQATDSLTLLDLTPETIYYGNY